MTSIWDFLKGTTTTDVFEQIARKANDAILIVDIITGEIIWHNTQLNKLLGYPDEENLKTFFDVVCDQYLEESAIWLAKVYEEKGGITTDICLKDRDGDPVDVEISAKVAPIQNRNASVLYIRDIRARLALMRQIQEKNQALMEGMNYARRIQNAVMPSEQDLHKLFPKNFVLYRPRDILSGDFYYFKKFQNLNFLVVGDCTGHGIPGALLVMLSISTFTDVLSDFYQEPIEEILSEVNARVTSTLMHEGSVIRDGLECSLIRWDGQEIHFGGCNQDLFLITENQLKVYKGNRISIGYNEYVTDSSFSSHTISVKKGDKIYLSTDGFPDQFGGKKQKKLTKGKFKKLLLETSRFPIQKQKAFLEDFLNNWMGDNPQTDDILVVGIEID